MKVYIETYGCAANKNNSEIIIGKALGGRHEIVNEIDKADIIIINTCTVKHITEQKMFSRLKKLKEKGNKVIVTGCMVPYQSDEIERISKDFIQIPWNDLDRFDKIFHIKSSQARDFSFSPVTRIIQIGTGCLCNCAYCAVKLIKGNIRSRSIEDILHDVEKALLRGYKEIYLTSTDNAAYGFDINVRLPDLVNEILERFDGDYIIRIGMMNPLILKLFYKEFMELYRDARIYKFLHLPIQSGSEKVLKEMHRPGKMEDVYAMHDSFMRITKHMGNFATDIIVGYPTETEEDFNKTMEVLKHLKPDMTHVSKFGPRKGTVAAKMKKLPSQIVKERSRKLSSLVREIAKERNMRWINLETETLIKDVTQSGLIGRNRYYKPIVITNENSKRYLGKWVKVKIVSCTHAHLIGEII